MMRPFVVATAPSLLTGAAPGVRPAALNPYPGDILGAADAGMPGDLHVE